MNSNTALCTFVGAVTIGLVLMAHQPSDAPKTPATPSADTVMYVNCPNFHTILHYHGEQLDYEWEENAPNPDYKYDNYGRTSLSNLLVIRSKKSGVIARLPLNAGSCGVSRMELP